MLNNINSKFIMEKIFINIKKIKKLKMIKYNKKLLNRLNITIEDFQKQKFINDVINKINRKYYLGIKDNEIEELKLNWNTNCNIILKQINKIEFKSIKNLNLSHNDNSLDIKI